MKMNKDVLAGMVLDYKESFDSTLSAINDELKELNTDFHKHKSDLAISRNVTEKLKKQLILVERKCWANEYQSGECLEISGILASIQNDDLEDCVLKIFDEWQTPVDPENIKARPKKVIIKLSKRKDMLNILQHKKKLKSVDMTKVGLPQGSLVFIN